MSERCVGRILATVILSTILITATARAQTQIKGRVMVLVDTSGSMVWHFGDCNTANGDGDGTALICDNSLATAFTCAQNTSCTLGHGALADFPVNLANPSRLYSAKAALNDVLDSAGGDLDFGLERYTLAGGCPDATNCCSTQTNGATRGRCVRDTDYPNVPTSASNITWSGGCGTSNGCKNNCPNTAGGQVIISPGAGSTASVFPWIDYTEDFCSSTGSVGGAPRNPELRAAGPTPLAGAIRSARKDWYTPIFTASNGGNCNPQTSNCDTQINCRPYVYVVMTDGGEDCEDQTVWFSDPTTAVQELVNVNTTNPVVVHVIALSFLTDEPCSGSCPKSVACKNGLCGCKTNADCGTTCDGFPFTCGADGACHNPASALVNNMAQVGGSSAAHFANNQTDIEAAFADIVASSVKFEKCNAADDNCNGFIDEGLGVYQECTINANCSTGNCNAGRCACAKDADCKSGYACAANLCVPACSTGVGACARTGVVKCTSATGTGCCLNDGKPTCTALTAGAPGTEICNGVDDNCNGVIDEGGVCQKCQPVSETCNGKDDDCDGVIDNNLVDTGKPCGLSVGVCKPGTSVCQNSKGQDVSKGNAPDSGDSLVCAGSTMAGAQMCNGCDNNCDGVVDRPQQTCYDGAVGTANVGPCHGGLHACTQMTCGNAATWGACIGEIVPGKETCNGVDDDCNGKVDDVPGSGVACCPSGKCGVGVCKAGTQQCSGGGLLCVGAVGPSAEICDGVDNDCNGKTDDVAGVGQACAAPMGSCAGTLACDLTKKQLSCQPSGSKMPEVCDGLDNDCNGVIDDPAEVAANDTRINKPCGNNTNLPPPCKAGVTVCVKGMVVCQGAIGPAPEVCDGIDNNCDGITDDVATCPGGFACINSGCYAPCGGGEFPCPGGYTCDPKTNHCLPDNCHCNACERCIGSTCVDSCQGLNCPNGFACKCGSCVDESCVVKGCPTGQRCDANARMCVVDPCFMAMCDVTQFCDPLTGGCVSTCANISCGDGQVCQQGTCIDDPCAKVKCAEGQVCDPMTMMCGQDPCFGVTCVPGFACIGGTCQQDPCTLTQCPAGTECKVTSVGKVNCAAIPVQPLGARDEVVGAGGGGFTCDAGRGQREGKLPLEGALMAAALCAWTLARRRRLQLARSLEEKR